MNILFVCTGNICRSPLAEGILRAKYTQKGINATIDSCGFVPFHVGDNPDPRAREIARRNGIDISTLRARLFRPEDFDRFDKIFVMDSSHYQAVKQMARNENDLKNVDFLLNVVQPGQNNEVKDPYFDNFSAFEIVFDQLNEACDKIADHAYTFKSTNQ